MNKMKILIIMVISFGLIASPAIAGCILPDTDFFYGATINNQRKANVPDDTQKSGLIASPAIAGCILPDTNFFYGATINNQRKANVPDDTQKSLTSEVTLKVKKTAATLPDDILAPEIFYGYTNRISK